MRDLTSSNRPPSLPRAAWILLGAVAAEAAITLGHFVYGASLYDDPGRYHVVVPALVSLAVVAALTAVVARRPHRAASIGLAVAVTIPFIGMFGIYHGVYGHLLKDVLFAAGATPETLERMFMSPDYALPEDFVFEATGILGAVAAAVVAWRLWRLLKVAWGRPAPAASGQATPAPDARPDAAAAEER